MESFGGQTQSDEAHDEQRRHLGPEDGKPHTFKEDAPNDYQKIAQGIQVGEPLNNNRHIGNGKYESGQEHSRKKEKEGSHHGLLLGLADGGD